MSLTIDDDDHGVAGLPTTKGGILRNGSGGRLGESAKSPVERNALGHADNQLIVARPGPARPQSELAAQLGIAAGRRVIIAAAAADDDDARFN